MGVLNGKTPRVKTTVALISIATLLSAVGITFKRNRLGDSWSASSYDSDWQDKQCSGLTLARTTGFPVTGCVKPMVYFSKYVCPYSSKGCTKTGS
jgi:hypothetical protein